MSDSPFPGLRLQQHQTSARVADFTVPLQICFRFWHGEMSRP